MYKNIVLTKYFFLNRQQAKKKKLTLYYKYSIKLIYSCNIKYVMWF